MAVMVTGAVQAQSVTFVQDRDARDAIGWPSHRAVPVVADWNGDGIMDAYYGGTSCTNGWQVRGVLVKGLGNGTYAGEIEPLLEDYEDQERVPETDENGNPRRDDNGDIIYKTDEIGEFIWQVVTRQRVVGMKNGLPYSAYGMASQTLDFNQDGLVDLLIQNVGGNDTGTDQALVLVKNNGDYTFSVVNDSVLASLTMNSAGEGWNERTSGEPWPWVTTTTMAIPTSSTRHGAGTAPTTSGDATSPCCTTARARVSRWLTSSARCLPTWSPTVSAST